MTEFTHCDGCTQKKNKVTKIYLVVWSKEVGIIQQKGLSIYFCYPKDQIYVLLRYRLNCKAVSVWRIGHPSRAEICMQWIKIELPISLLTEHKSTYLTSLSNGYMATSIFFFSDRFCIFWSKAHHTIFFRTTCEEKNQTINPTEGCWMEMFQKLKISGIPQYFEKKVL